MLVKVRNDPNGFLGRGAGCLLFEAVVSGRLEVVGGDAEIVEEGGRLEGVVAC